MVKLTIGSIPGLTKFEHSPFEPMRILTFEILIISKVKACSFACKGRNCHTFLFWHLTCGFRCLLPTVKVIINFYVNKNNISEKYKRSNFLLSLVFEFLSDLHSNWFHLIIPKCFMCKKNQRSVLAIDTFVFGALFTND